MSGYSGFASAALQLGLESVLIKPKDRGLKNIIAADGSSLQDIKAFAVVEERHSDHMEVTRHPLEKGADISDHAYKLPAEVVLELGWSNSPPMANGLLGAAWATASSVSPAVAGVANAIGVGQAVLSGINAFQSNQNGAQPDQVTLVYQQLLELQNVQALFDIYTGKRKYTNMVCTSLVTSTDNRTENSMIITMTCQQVIIVDTKVIPIANPKNASDNSAPTPTGNKSLQTATMSAN